MLSKQIAGEIAELYVFGELLKRGVLPYLPVVDEGLDALARTSGGQVIELQIKSAGSAGGRCPRWFQMPTVDPRTNFFIIGVEFNDGEPTHAWVFPAIIFDKYATRPASGSARDLDLESGVRKYGLALRDLLCGFKNRWELIVDFEHFEPMMKSPEDLEDILTEQEALEAPDEEAITIGEYERLRSTTLSS